MKNKLKIDEETSNTIQFEKKQDLIYQELEKLKKPFIGPRKFSHKRHLDNKFIIKGFRCNYNNIHITLISIFQIHNEQTNIITHILGSLYYYLCYLNLDYLIETNDALESKLFNVLTNQYYNQNIYQSHKSELDIFPLQASLFACIGGLFCSSIFHTFNCISDKYWKYLLRLDYSAICISFAGTIFPVIYYSFYCSDLVFWAFAVGSQSICLITFLFTLSDYLHQEQNRLTKVLLYATVGIIMIFIAFYAYLVGQRHLESNGYYISLNTASIFYMYEALTGFCGQIIYLKRCPERFKQGVFDNLGQSHNLWHLGIFLAGIFANIENLAQVSFSLIQSHE